MTADAPRSMTMLMTGFSEALRAHGMPTHPRAVVDACRSVELVGVEDRLLFHAALRANFITDPAHFIPFDHVFDAWWTKRRLAEAGDEQPESMRLQPVTMPPGEHGDQSVSSLSPPARSGAGDMEAALKKDLKELTPEEEPLFDKILKNAVSKLTTMEGRRYGPARTGRKIDFARTLRREARTGGELLRLLKRKKKPSRRRLAFLGDVSGSMETYGRFFFKMAYGFAAFERSTEVYAFSTKLFNLTAHVRDRTSEGRLTRGILNTKGWSGGTMVGRSLKDFHESLRRRAHLSKTVVIILSDGWDRGDPALLKREMARLKSAVDAIYWLNPLKGVPGYKPLSRGMATALPYLDGFFEAGNIKALASFAKFLAGTR